MNLEEYLPIMLFLLVGIAVGGGAQLMGRLLGPYRPSEAKNTQYECGFDAFEDARVKFDVRYYLLAILFILFDLEAVFFFPWAASMRELGWQGFVVIMIFVAEIAVVFWYLWKRGALDWE